MKSYSIFALFFVFFNGFGQNITLKKGIVNTDLEAHDSLHTKYSLFIPSNYDSNTLYPMLFVFDPEGDGMRAARLFKSAIGEDFVIAATNEKLGDSLEYNLELGLSMIKDVVNKIRLDPNHIYTTGLDEGARVASGLTFVINNISGVLAINDIFFKMTSNQNFKKENFIGMVGDASPNYYGMQNVFDRLKMFKKENVLYEYAGEGGWPRVDYLGSIFNTLYLQQSEKVKEEIPQSYIDLSFTTDYNTADALIKRQNYTIAYNFLSELKDKYRRKHDLDSLRGLQKDLRRLKGYKNQRNRIANSSENETYLVEDISYFLQDDISTANFENLGYWDDKVQQLETAAKDDSKPYEQMVAKRILGYINTSLDDYISVLNSAGTASQKIFPNVLKTILKPQNYQSYLNIIEIAAKDKDDNTAYFYLEEMLKKGFKGYDKLYSIPNTEVLKISPTYNYIINRYLGKSKYQ
ncbi:MAG: hypothetical protein V7767_09685 [Leeuwenhoekiella sp.]